MELQRQNLESAVQDLKSAAPAKPASPQVKQSPAKNVAAKTVMDPKLGQSVEVLQKSFAERTKIVNKRMDKFE